MVETTHRYMLQALNYQTRHKLSKLRSVAIQNLIRTVGNKRFAIVHTGTSSFCFNESCKRTATKDTPLFVQGSNVTCCKAFFEKRKHGWKHWQLRMLLCMRSDVEPGAGVERQMSNIPKFSAWISKTKTVRLRDTKSKTCISVMGSKQRCQLRQHTVHCSH